MNLIGPYQWALFFGIGQSRFLLATDVAGKKFALLEIRASMTGDYSEYSRLYNTFIQAAQIL